MQKISLIKNIKSNKINNLNKPNKTNIPNITMYLRIHKEVNESMNKNIKIV